MTPATAPPPMRAPTAPWMRPKGAGLAHDCSWCRPDPVRLVHCQRRYPLTAELATHPPAGGDDDGWSALVAGRLPAAGELVERYGPIVAAGPRLVLAQLGQSLDGFIAARTGDACFVTGRRRSDPSASPQGPGGCSRRRCRHRHLRRLSTHRAGRSRDQPGARGPRPGRSRTSGRARAVGGRRPYPVGGRRRPSTAQRVCAAPRGRAAASLRVRAGIRAQARRGGPGLPGPRSRARRRRRRHCLPVPGGW